MMDRSFEGAIEFHEKHPYRFWLMILPTILLFDLFPARWQWVQKAKRQIQVYVWGEELPE